MSSFLKLLLSSFPVSRDTSGRKNSLAVLLVLVCASKRRHYTPKKYPLSKVHCKKELAIFLSPAGMSLTKLSLGGGKLNYSRPGRVWSVTSRLGTGKRLTRFYSVLASCICLPLSVKKLIKTPTVYFCRIFRVSITLSFQPLYQALPLTLLHSVWRVKLAGEGGGVKGALRRRQQ